jgi:O-antigen/teichoic acid export membrane protein
MLMWRAIRMPDEQEREGPTDGGNLVRGGLWISAGRLAAVAARFLAGLAVARILGPEGRGNYALLVLIPTLLSQILNLGLGQANTYLLGRRHSPVGQVAANSLLWGTLAGTAVVIGVLAAGKVLRPMLLPNLPLSLIALSCAAVPFALIHFFASYALLGLGQVNKFGILLLVEGVGQLLYLAIFMIAMKWGLAGATLAWTLTAVTCCLLSVAWLARPAWSTLGPNLRTFREALVYGLRIYPAGIMQYLNLRFDQFLVEYFAGAGPLGLYAVAVSVTEATWQIPIAVSTALFSRVSTTTDRQADAITPRVLRFTIAITALEVGILLMFGGLFLRMFFGAAFEAALPALYWLLPGTLLYCVPRVLEGDLAGRGHPLICSLAAAMAVMATIALDLLWIPRRGIVGAAWASSVAYGLNAGILLAAFTRTTGINGWRLLWPQGRSR